MSRSMCVRCQGFLCPITLFQYSHSLLRRSFAMPPPETQSTSNEGFVSSGAPQAPSNGCLFPTNTFPIYPVSGSFQPQQTSVYNVRQQVVNLNPNQFFATTTTPAQMPPPMSQHQAMMPEVQSSTSANAIPPFLIYDPIALVKAYQQNALASQQQQQKAQVFHQAQMQFKDCVQPPNTVVSNQTPQLDPNAQIQQCAAIINQALNDPQYNAAGQVLLQAMQSSSTFMNGLMNQPRKFVEVEQPKMAIPQYTTKTVVPNQVTSFINPPQKPFQVEEAKAVMSHEPKMKVSPDMNPSFVPNQGFLGCTLEPIERQDTEEVDSAEEEMWKVLMTCNDEGDLDSSSEPTTVPAAHPLSRTSLADVQPSSPLQTQPLQQAPQIKSNVLNHQSLPPLSANRAPAALAKPDKVVPVRADCGKVKKAPQSRKRQANAFDLQGSPQQYLMAILKERGYSTDLVPNTEAGYQSGPTRLQLASFGTEVVKAVNSGDVSTLSALLDCGISPSPCNSFGDYIVHLVCKRADIDILQCLVDHGCNLDVCDSFGRTPLHCVAWAGEFCSKSAELILDRNLSQILVQDNHGRCPLDYVRKDDYVAWIEFVRSKMDTYWPIDKAAQPSLPSAKHQQEAPTISLDVVAALASGAMSPEAFAVSQRYAPK